MEGYVIVVRPRQAAETVVRVGERREKFLGRTTRIARLIIEVASDRAVIRVDYELRRIIENGAEIIRRTALQSRCLDV